MRITRKLSIHGGLKRYRLDRLSLFRESISFIGVSYRQWGFGFTIFHRFPKDHDDAA